MSESKVGCFTKILRWLNFMLIILTGISFAAPYFNPSSFWPFIFMGLGFPVLVLLNMLFVLFWMYQRKWYFIFSMICLIMSWSGVSKFTGNPFRGSVTAKGKVVKVMTFNAQGGNIYNNKLYPQFIDMMKAQDPDVICLQELGLNVKELESFSKEYPHQVGRGSQHIVSKFPIRDSKDLKLEKIKTSNGALWADIEMEGYVFRLYNIHLHSNRISSEVDDLSENTELNELNDKETLDATRGILSQVKSAAAVRAGQAKKVRASIEASSRPVILCGDFNDPPQSYTYRILCSRLKDTFVEGGLGLGFTYNGNIPFLKIDYILSSPEITVLSSKTVSTSISDHKPMVSTLVLPIK